MNNLCCDLLFNLYGVANGVPLNDSLIYLILMDTKKIFAGVILFSSLVGFMGCKECEGDTFGHSMKLVVPIDTYPSVDTFTIGDTLWIEADIDKYVAVEDNDERIFLEDFNFFTTLIISEISDTVENFAVEIEIIEEIGTVEILDLPTLQVYPLFFVENDDAYLFKGGIVFNEPGRYYISFDTNPENYKRYEHPAVYLCEDTRRNDMDVGYRNTSTTLEAYENIFLQTGVDYLFQLMDYPRYSSIGTHCLIVKE